jgi:hypothetical protein
MTVPQRVKLQAVVRRIHFLDSYGIDEAHHGMCEGADEQFHHICMNLGIPIVGHPPENTRYLMDYDPAWFARMHEPKPYLVRNRAIVDSLDLASDRLIAAPKEMEEVKRSGTWSTLRYARNRCKNLTIKIDAEGYSWEDLLDGGLNCFGRLVDWEKQIADKQPWQAIRVQGPVSF